jgi:hypothetical protein
MSSFAALFLAAGQALILRIYAQPGEMIQIFFTGR